MIKVRRPPHFATATLVMDPLLRDARRPGAYRGSFLVSRAGGTSQARAVEDVPVVIRTAEAASRNDLWPSGGFHSACWGCVAVDITPHHPMDPS